MAFIRLSLRAHWRFLALGDRSLESTNKFQFSRRRQSFTLRPLFPRYVLRQEDESLTRVRTVARKAVLCSTLFFCVV